MSSSKLTFSLVRNGKILYRDTANQKSQFPDLNKLHFKWAKSQIFECR